MSIDAAVQAAAWRMRRANRSRFYTLQATPWSAGLTVVKGDIVQSNQLAWQAQNSGTTAGATAPNNTDGAAFTDAGGIVWVHLPLLLVAPTKIT